jgi:hypothetical protein
MLCAVQVKRTKKTAISKKAKKLLILVEKKEKRVVKSVPEPLKP